MKRPDVPDGGDAVGRQPDRRVRPGKAAWRKPVARARGAPRAQLIRRAYYDLTGLPPTPEEIDAFVADASADAYEKVIDRLLASPHYGEKWGRHWLDLSATPRPTATTRQRQAERVAVP